MMLFKREVEAMEFEQAQEELLGTFDKCKSLLGSKDSDYGHDTFIEAARIATVLTGHKVESDDVVACLVGVKCSRYGRLSHGDVEVKHEALEDTEIDFINYVGLMFRERKRYQDERSREKSKRDLF